MGADMSLRTIYLRANTPFDKPAAIAMAQTLTSAADSDELAWLNEQYDFDLPADATLAQRREAALGLLTRLLNEFDTSLHSRDVSRYQLCDLGAAAVDEYATGGLSNGDSPTDAYDQWDFLLDEEWLPHRWGEYLATAGGLLHPHGDGPVVTVVAFRDFGHLPA